MNNTIHIVLAVYDPKGTYSQHAGVVMASTFSNTQSRVCFHILHDETLTDGNRKNFVLLAEQFGQEVNFINVSENIKQFDFDVDALTGNFSRGSLFRLFVPELLPINRVIYLDCDMIVNLDIKELLDIDLEGYYAGAVVDKPTNSRKKFFFCGYLGINSSTYFNSGTMFLNLKLMRENALCLPKEAMNFFSRYPNALLPDQDFLNKKLFGMVKLIDRKFNYCGSSLDYSIMEGKIWHLTGEKPWDIPAGVKTDSLYWEYYAKTPWCGNLVDDILVTWKNSKYMHGKSSRCFEKICRNLKYSISPKSSVPIFTISVMWHDLIYRIKKKIAKK